jgi:TRAP-type C4-dicarboxylate transport system permease large subunit
VLVEANILMMFAGALLPGLIAVAGFLLAIAAYVAVRPDAGPAGAAVGGAELRAASLGALPVLGVFLLVLGGIYAGLYAPTQAAAVGVGAVGLYALALGRLKRGDLRAALTETATTTGMILLILLGAEMMKIFLARVRLPQMAADWVLAAGIEPFAVLLLMLLALILLGCLMDSLSMILLAIPFFWPVLLELNGGPFQGAEGAGFGMSTDELKIWFGILALVVVELGLITPPVGMNVFVISAMARDVPMADTFRGVLPFFLAELVRVALLLAFPALVLWLPRLLEGG